MIPMPDYENGERRCPRCGGPARDVAVVGPTEAVVFPCQHRVAPQAVLDCGDESDGS